MSLAAQMTRPVTIEHRGMVLAADEYGNPLTSTVTTTDLLGYFEQAGQSEITVGQETYTVDALLILPPLTPLDGSDRVIVDGYRYEVVGVPARPWRPITGEHHVEVRLRVTTG